MSGIQEKIERKRWWKNLVAISIIISLPGVQLCYFPGVLLQSLPHPDTPLIAACTHKRHLSLIYPIIISRPKPLSIYKLHTVCVCSFVRLPLSVCSSTRWALGNFSCLVRRSQGEDFVSCAIGEGVVLVGARKPGHISCGNGVITSPITGAITVGGLQKPGNKAHRHTDGHSMWGHTRAVCAHTKSFLARNKI